ncbi:transposase-like zinc ribbon protein [Haloarcula quadrata]|uniref:Transposase-like zinc ribbon protein n=1 Tax=Haloarcula quadrata TaxID=182779 RepID=A0A495QQL0_9EURY|nr:transposase-like zinc ribbon protein [Haloarcula quadrata]
MVSRESVNEVFLPDKEDCLEYLREQRWPDEVTCPHCRSADTIKKGTTRKDAQRYRCQDCESIFNDLTGTVFAEHQLTIPEMFHIIRGMEEHTTNGISYLCSCIILYRECNTLMMSS